MLSTLLRLPLSFSRAALLVAAVSSIGFAPAQAAFAAGPPGSRSAEPELRQTVVFNRQWRFQSGDTPGAETAAFDDSPWQDVGLPHSFSLPYFGSSHFYQGYGWYRKHFDVPESWSDKRIHLEFDGVFQVAEVFVNGRRAGEHKGGYTGFSLDVTDALRDGDNVVAVRVNNLWNPRLAPRAGEHTFSGGIYRDVRLVVTAPLHVAWYGTFVTTPHVSTETATVNVKTEVVNDLPSAKSATVRTAIIDADGKTVAEMESAQTVPAHATLLFDQTSGTIAAPHLWHPEHPYLYTVKTTVLDDGKAADEFLSPLGFRWFQFTAKKGFFLNGEHRYLRGANVHQDHAGWGDAVADSGFFRDVRMVKDAGFDFIRGSHYPHAPAFADACDKLGALFWSENCFWGIGGFRDPQAGAPGYWNASAYPPDPKDQPEFEASVKQQLCEMVRIHRNHPSIVAWSMGNETFFTKNSTLPKLRDFLAELVRYTHSLDPTRPAAIGGVQRPLDENRIDRIGDLAGYNGDGSSLPMFQDSGVASLVAEYGSTTAVRPGKYEPGWGSLAKDNGQAVYPWRSGQAIWCMFDHGSIAGADLGCMGIVDYYRLPKRAWYWYRNEYRNIPPPAWPREGLPAGLKLAADKTELRSADGTDDAQVAVSVVDKDGKPISNCPPVTLTVVRGPGEFPTGPSITFEPHADIAIRDGQAAMEFRSYFAGRTSIRATSPGLRDATIEIISAGEPKFIAGKTPPAKPRRYVRYPGELVFAPNARFGMHSPTLASSEALDHSGALANDGDIATFWQADAADRNAWWRVDLEKTVTVDAVTLTFPTEDTWRYRVEISDDGESGWRLVADEMGNADAARIRRSRLAKGVNGRFLRVTFGQLPPGKTAALAEVEVLGIVCTR